MELKKSKVQKTIEKYKDNEYEALQVIAKDYLEKHLRYQKKKFMDCNVMTLSLVLSEVFHAGAIHGIESMTISLGVDVDFNGEKHKKVEINNYIDFKGWTEEDLRLLGITEKYIDEWRQTGKIRLRSD